MSAVDGKSSKRSGKNFTFIMGGAIVIVAGLLFVYLMFYTSPEYNMESVKIIAITENGCIAETMDGYSVNIGNCDGNPGQYVDALVDQKVKDRTAAMNP